LKTSSALGHLSIVVGCFLFSWGILVAPNIEPNIKGIIINPVFWGLIAIFGGICANTRRFRKEK